MSNKRTAARSGKPRGRNNTTAASVITNHEPSAWLRAQLNNIDQAITTGLLEPCHPLRLYILDLWAPGKLACFNCYTPPPLTPAEDMRCDRCQQVTDWCSPTQVPLPTDTGLVVVRLGLCRECNRKELAR